MTGNGDSDRELFLVLRAQSGSHEALNDLFKLLQEPLFRYVRSLVKEQAHAEDVLQEVFFRIYRKLKWLREPRALRPWAYQIASREAFRFLRRDPSRIHKIVAEDELQQLPIENTDAQFSEELIKRLPQLVEKLSPASRAVIVLYYLHELSLHETASVLEIPVGTVKSRLAYGLAALRRDLANEFEE